MGCLAGEKGAALAVEDSPGNEHEPVQGKVLFLIHKPDRRFQVSDAAGKGADPVFVFHVFVMEDFFQEGHRGLLVIVGKPGAGNGQVSERKEFGETEDLVQGVEAVTIPVLQGGGKDAMVIVVNKGLPVNTEQPCKFYGCIVFPAFHDSRPSHSKSL